MLEYRHSQGVMMGVFDKIFNKKQDSTSGNSNSNITVDENNVILPRTLVTTPIKQDPKLQKKLQKINLKLIQTTKRQREEMLSQHNHEEQKLAKELEKIEREIAILEGREIPIAPKQKKEIQIQPFDVEEYIESPHVHVEPKKSQVAYNQRMSKILFPKQKANSITSQMNITNSKNVNDNNSSNNQYQTNTNLTPNSITKSSLLTTTEKPKPTLHKIKEHIIKVKNSFKKKPSEKDIHTLPPHKRPLDKHHAPQYTKPTLIPHHLPPHKKCITQQAIQDSTASITLDQNKTNNQLEHAILELQAKWQVAKNKPLAMHPTHKEKVPNQKITHKGKSAQTTKKKTTKKSPLQSIQAKSKK